MIGLPLDRVKWPLMALMASAFSLGVAYFIFENLLNEAPCQMCWWQRYVYFAALVIGALAIVLHWRGASGRLMSIMSVLLGAIFLVGVFLASWHALFEWNLAPGPQGCEAAGIGEIRSDRPLSEILSTPQKIPSCKEPWWRVPNAPWGLSMAGLNAVWSVVLAGLSFYAAFRAPAVADTANEPVRP